MKVLLALFVSPLLGFWVGFGIHRIGRRLLAGAKPTANATLRKMQFFTAAALAFSHGANDAQKSMGMLTLVLLLGGFIPSFEVPFWVVLSCATAITLGIMSGGWRIVRTLGFAIYRVRPLHAFDSQLTSALLIFSASMIGAPVSTTHVVATSIMGIGYSERPRAVRWKKAKDIAKTWVITIPAAALTPSLFTPLPESCLARPPDPWRDEPWKTTRAKPTSRSFRRLYERVFPTVADFFGMLAEQSANAAETTRLLVEFMETGDVSSARKFVPTSTRPTA
jgi:phosphate/sulfate permease